LKRINALLLTVILTLSVFSAPLAALAQNGDSDVAATINGVEISRQQFMEHLEAEYGYYALRDLIERELIRQRAESLQITVDETEFNQTYELIASQFGGPMGLQLVLLQNGLSEEQFKDQIRFSLLVSALTRAEVEVTEEQLLQWFEANRASYDQPLAVEVSHILVDSEELAKDLLAQLEAGADMAALAQEHSLDPGSAYQGGYLGMITMGLTVPEFDETAFSLEPGAFGIAESVYGWHIITVHSKQEAKAAEYAEIADRVADDYRKAQALDVQSYLQKLEQEADVQVIWQP